jgi:hypothetical protein
VLVMKVVRVTVGEVVSELPDQTQPQPQSLELELDPVLRVVLLAGLTPHLVVSVSTKLPCFHHPPQCVTPILFVHSLVPPLFRHHHHHHHPPDLAISISA